jgi:hypothetical protein
VHVSEGSRDTEIRTNCTQSFIDIIDVLRLCVKAGIVDPSIIDTVFLTAGDTDLHFQPQSNFRHAGEVLDTGSDIVVLGFFGKIKHVGGEKRFLVLFKVGFVSLDHSVKPRKKLVCTMVAVEDYGAESRDGKDNA